VKIIYLIFLLLFIGCSQLPKKRSDKLSIIQGLTSSKEVEFSVVALKGTELRFELRSAEDDVLAPADIKTVTRPFSNYVIYKMVFNYDQKKFYNLYAFNQDQLIDQRLVGKGQKGPSSLRLAVASCMDDHYEKHFKIWNTLSGLNPDYLLLIGDNVYTDRGPSLEIMDTDPKLIWQRYIDLRLSLPIFFVEKLIPIHALWDDHDFGVNNGGAAYPHKKESKEIFDAFYAQGMSGESFSPGYGVGGLLSLGDYNLYFLDARTFRSSDSEGTHLGSDQKQWLINNLKQEVSPSLIIKGDQFFGGYHRFESYEGNHPKEFSDFTKELRELQTPLVFLSGDRHMSEIMQFPRHMFGSPSFEITSSPIHGKLHPQASESNPWRVVSEKARMNFTIIDNLAKDNHWFMEVRSIGENGELFYRRDLAVYIKDLQDNLIETRKHRHGKRRYRKIRGKKR
jgi:alkaline phosphatase D